MLFLTFEEYFCSLAIDPSDTNKSQLLWSSLSFEEKTEYIVRFRQECIPDDRQTNIIVSKINERILSMRNIVSELSTIGIAHERGKKLFMQLRKEAYDIRNVMKNHIHIFCIRKSVSVILDEIIINPFSTSFSIP